MLTCYLIQSATNQLLWSCKKLISNILSERETLLHVSRSGEFAWKSLKTHLMLEILPLTEDVGFVQVDCLVHNRCHLVFGFSVMHTDQPRRSNHNNIHHQPPSPSAAEPCILTLIQIHWHKPSPPTMCAVQDKNCSEAARVTSAWVQGVTQAFK